MFLFYCDKFRNDLIRDEKECPHPNILSKDEYISEYVLPLLAKSFWQYKAIEPDNHLEFFAEYFLREYEKGSTKKTKAKDDLDLFNENKIFNKCVESVLKNCDLSHLSILPQALNVIKKHKRLSWAKTHKWQSLTDRKSCLRKEIDLSKRKKNEIEVDEDKKKSKEEISISDTSVKSSTLNIRDILETFILSNPMWKEKLQTEPTNKECSYDIISDHSLVELWSSLRQISEEIGQRLIEKGYLPVEKSPTTVTKQPPPRHSSVVSEESVNLSDKLSRASKKSDSKSFDCEGLLQDKNHPNKEFIMEVTGQRINLSQESADILIKDDNYCEEKEKEELFEREDLKEEEKEKL